MHRFTLLVASLIASGLLAQGALRAQGPADLTAEDRLDTEQLVYRYAHAIDTCANEGYDYADVYTEDGVFVDNFSDQGFAQGGLVRAVGREQLARSTDLR